jgi:Flp pilus assembly protein TadD
MQKAIRLNPDDLEAWSHMAVLYQRAGRTADQKIAEERGKALTAAHRTHQN